MTENTSESSGVSRRDVLRKTTAAGAVLLVGAGASGTVAGDQEDGRFNDSPGRGGQAVMPAAEFRGDQEFVITERTGDSAEEIEGATFQCNGGNGEPLFLVGWYFQYTDSDEEHILYTRSNNIDTGRTFVTGGRNGRVCEDGITHFEDGPPVVEDGVQFSYQSTGNQKDDKKNR